MSTLHPDASSFSQPGREPPVEASVPPYLVRTMRQYDLPGLADLLASSFHSQDGTFGWMYPLLRMGIYEDLRSRLRAKQNHQVCLVAVQPAAPDASQPSPLALRSPQVAVAQAVAGGDRLLGVVELSVRTPLLWQPRTQHLYLSNLAVNPRVRRQGVALKLLQTCEQVAQEWGYHDLYLHVLENNHQAKRLYLKVGYRLKRVDTNFSSLLLRRPRQLFLHKSLS